MPEYFISCDNTLLDAEFIVRSLQSTYWAGTRPREVILESMQRSLCFGAYLTDSRQQVGFARVVTDQTTFSWLCDVFVEPAHRRCGLGKRLVAELLSDPRIAKTRVYLGTKDAHGLYERFGFARWELMRRPTEPNSEASGPAPIAVTPPARP